jgi:phosphate transport system protein
MPNGVGEKMLLTFVCVTRPPGHAEMAIKRVSPKHAESIRKMTDLIRQACLVAKDSAFNVREYTRDSSKMAFLAVKDCEKELDRIERKVDESITGAITAVSEAEARELLACLKFIIDLERIGDLLWSAAKRLQALGAQLSRDDVREVEEMAGILESMLQKVHQGFLNRDVEAASWVLQTDARIDEACRAIFRRHLEKADQHKREYSTNLLFIAQAFERAGDHAKNLAEEIFHLVEGRSLRHELKRRSPGG